jgi:hypothetical protein
VAEIPACFLKHKKWPEFLPTMTALCRAFSEEWRVKACPYAWTGLCIIPAILWVRDVKNHAFNVNNPLIKREKNICVIVPVY